MIGRQSERAAVELCNGLYRLVELSWTGRSTGDAFDYFHAAIETDGRWNAEFHAANGHSVWVLGSEEQEGFDWKYFTPDGALEDPEAAKARGIEVVIRDVEFADVPPGALCQTVDERGDGIPKHWKNWRIV